MCVFTALIKCKQIFKKFIVHLTSAVIVAIIHLLYIWRILQYSAELALRCRRTFTADIYVDVEKNSAYCTKMLKNILHSVKWKKLKSSIIISLSGGIDNG